MRLSCRDDAMHHPVSLVSNEWCMRCAGYRWRVGNAPYKNGRVQHAPTLFEKDEVRSPLMERTSIFALFFRKN